MLKNLDPLLSPALLHVLASMGHGDEVALVDRNFPGTTHARRLVPLDGASLSEGARAILSVLPIDTFVNQPVAAMQVVGAPDEVPDVQREVFELVNAAEGRVVDVERIERHAFYRRAAQAFAVVTTSEVRPYGCVLLTKGVL